MSKLFIRVLGIAAVMTLSACFAYASVTSGETTSIVPSTGISASGVVSNTCSGEMWSCVADPIGYPDGDTTYVYTTGASGSHVVGFSGSISKITSVSMHIVAASNGGSGTVTMSFYNNGNIAGQGGTKNIDSGSGYTEYVSGIFYTSISDISDLTMKVSLTGSVKYTAIWLDLTFGSAGTMPYSDLENYIMATGGDSSDYDWDAIYPNNIWVGGSCTSSGCAGGVGASAPTVTRYATSPSARNGDTSATKIFFSAPSGADTDTASALEWVKMNGNETSIPPLRPNQTSVTADWWIYIQNASSNNPRTLEFDIWWGDGEKTAMWGTHCVMNRSDGVYVWELDAQDVPVGEGKWAAVVDAQTGQPIPCNLAPGQWHHVRWQVHHDPNAKDATGTVVGRIYYDYLTIDDNTTYILTGASKTYGYKYYKRPQFDSMGIQAQQDLNLSTSAPVSITEYVDAMSFTYW